MEDVEILKRELVHVGEDFAEIVMKIPSRNEPPPLTLYWLHIEIIERYHILSKAHIEPGATILEVGCGPFAISTAVLAYLVGEKGHVLAVDLGRWKGFEDTLQATTLRERVQPIACDATHLPFRSGIDMAVSIHALRSFSDESTIVNIFREMFRVSSHVFIAAYLPIAKTKAQKACMEMYNLREEIFEALSGKKDDIHYFPLKNLVAFVDRAGGTVTETKTVDIDLPHCFGFMPREIVERIKDVEKKDNLLEKWERACEKIKKYGEGRPPVGVVKAVKE